MNLPPKHQSTIMCNPLRTGLNIKNITFPIFLCFRVFVAKTGFLNSTPKNLVTC
jgi:hypothetical protein